ncbi:amidohydrolase, partial [Candidatus Bathyarchaeota archaeon]|nr:amidohydrolase [Candidatus Bathyarchaeota archaeon]
GRYPMASPEHLITYMDRLGIDVSVATPLASGLWHNQYVQEGVMRHGGRLVGFYWVNPRSAPGVEDMVRMLTHGGFRGVKLRPESEGFRIDNLNLLAPILEAAEGLGAPVYIHSSYESRLSAPEAVERVAEAFPDVPILVGHMGGGSWSAVRVAGRRENLYLETSGTRSPRLILEAVRALGAERVVYGSDFPYLRPEAEMAKIECLRIPKEDKELIMGGNMTRLLRIEACGRT